MKGILPLFLGLFGTFAFSWFGLAMIPNYQIGRLDPEVSKDDENDIYPVPKSGMAERGRQVYTGNGCYYCHSQQVRPEYAAADIDRKWGKRRSAPRDYIFERPALIGKMRLGPDLANLGSRSKAEEEAASAAGASPAASPGAPAAPAAGSAPATPASSPAVAAASPAAAPGVSPPPGPAPETESSEPRLYSAAWHHKHLYSPRSVLHDSNMPAYRFLYQKHRVSGQPSADALKLTGKDAPPEGWEIIPTYEAKCLVAYLMSLDQSHPLKEVKSAPAAAATTTIAAPAAPAPPK